MSATKVNNFHECLARSHAAADLPIWEEIYRRAFPGFITLVDERKNGWWQAAGIDRRIVMPECRQEILVDEKFRGRNRITRQVYEDVALEFLSNDRTGAPGWVCKPLRSDFIAYAILPLGKCYLLPVIQLQEAWKKFGDEWKRKFKVRQAANNGYMTHFTPVPPAVLFSALGRELRPTFTPLDVWDDLTPVSIEPKQESNSREPEAVVQKELGF